MQSPSPSVRRRLTSWPRGKWARVRLAVVVSDHHGIFVHDCRLQAPVRADERASLLSKRAKIA